MLIREHKVVTEHEHDLKPETRTRESRRTLNAACVECRVYSTLSEIEEIRSEWERLVNVSFCNRAFASPEWFLASCRMQERTPFVAVAMRGEKIVSLLPLALNNETGIAEFPHFGNDYNDILTSEEELAATVELFNYAIIPR